MTAQQRLKALGGLTKSAWYNQFGIDPIEWSHQTQNVISPPRSDTARKAREDSYNTMRKAQGYMEQSAGAGLMSGVADAVPGALSLPGLIPAGISWAWNKKFSDDPEPWAHAMEKYVGTPYGFLSKHIGVPFADGYDLNGLQQWLSRRQEAVNDEAVNDFGPDILKSTSGFNAAGDLTGGFALPGLGITKGLSSIWRFLRGGSRTANATARGAQAMNKAKRTMRATGKVRRTAMHSRPKPVATAPVAPAQSSAARNTWRSKGIKPLAYGGVLGGLNYYGYNKLYDSRYHEAMDRYYDNQDTAALSGENQYDDVGSQVHTPEQVTEAQKGPTVFNARNQAYLKNSRNTSYLAKNPEANWGARDDDEDY